MNGWMESLLDADHQRRDVYTRLPARALLSLAQVGHTLLHLHLPSGPDFNQKFDVIIDPNASPVCGTSRPQLCFADDRWRAVECELLSALFRIRVKHSLYLSQDRKVWTQYPTPSPGSAHKILTSVNGPKDPHCWCVLTTRMTSSADTDNHRDTYFSLKWDEWQYDIPDSSQTQTFLIRNEWQDGTGHWPSQTLSQTRTLLMWDEWQDGTGHWPSQTLTLFMWDESQDSIGHWPSQTLTLLIWDEWQDGTGHWSSQTQTLLIWDECQDGTGNWPSQKPTTIMWDQWLNDHIPITTLTRCTQCTQQTSHFYFSRKLSLFTALKMASLQKLCTFSCLVSSWKAVIFHPFVCLNDCTATTPLNHHRDPYLDRWMS